MRLFLLLLIALIAYALAEPRQTLDLRQASDTQRNAANKGPAEPPKRLLRPQLKRVPKLSRTVEINF